MFDLKTEQEKVFQALRQIDAHCFLKVDQSDDALWVSDLPRRCNVQVDIPGIHCMVDDRKLLHLDLEDWDKVLNDLPTEIPSFPTEESQHAAYALCRFGLLHPTPHTAEGLRMVRAIWKGKANIRALHEQAVEAQRRGSPIAYDTARLLAAILSKEERA